MQDKQRQNDYYWKAVESGDSQLVVDSLNVAKYGDLAADVNLRREDEWTTLHVAASEGHYYVTKVLIEHNAEIDALTTSHRTPLHIACIRYASSY